MDKVLELTKIVNSISKKNEGELFFYTNYLKGKNYTKVSLYNKYFFDINGDFEKIIQKLSFYNENHLLRVEDNIDIVLKNMKIDIISLLIAIEWLIDVNPDHLEFVFDYVSNVNNLNEVKEKLDNTQIYDSVEDFADEIIESMYNIPDFIKNCIDYEKLGKSLLYDYFHMELDDGEILVMME